jgi:hypothetical protein
MAQTPVDLVAHSITPPPPQHPPRDQTDDVLARPVSRLRMCVLCGHPLRTGQHLTRVQGSTVHARCCGSSR